MRKVLILMVCIIWVTGCKKNKAPGLPAQATLLFPDNNAACITGTVISDTTNTIQFSWNKAKNATSYEIDVKNLLTSGVSKYTTDQPGLNVILLRNTPYSWYVVSKSDLVSATATSAVWKFYNSGPGVISHAPFPAQLTLPVFGQIITPSSGKTMLEWTGDDVDEDIVGYDVYFGTATTPPLFQANVTSDTPMSVSVTDNTTYYWQIVTKDSKGNTSTSDVYQFMVN